MLKRIILFILAFAVAAVLEFPVRALVRHGWKRSIASAVLTLAVLGVLAWLTVKLTVWGISAVNGFAGEIGHTCICHNGRLVYKILSLITKFVLPASKSISRIPVAPANALSPKTSNEEGKVNFVIAVQLANA